MRSTEATPAGFKQRLDAAAAGSTAVQALAGIRFLGIGAGVRRAHDAWHERRRRRWMARENRAARDAWTHAPAALEPSQRRVLDALTSSGMAHVDLRALPGGEALWPDLVAAAEAWLDGPDVRQREAGYLAADRHKGKDYLIRLYGRNAPIPWESPWLRLAIAPAIVDVVNAYLALLAKIIYIDVWNTVPLHHSGPDIGSQKWHRDPEDARLVKVFLYLRDVTDGAGPFEYVPHSRAGERHGDLWPQQFPAGSIPPEAEVNAAIPAVDRVRCVHPAGTLLFVDTAGLHRGGRADADRRLVATCTYTTHACVWPRAFAIDRDRVPDTLSPTARMALLTPDEPATF